MKKPTPTLNADAAGIEPATVPAKSRKADNARKWRGSAPELQRATLEEIRRLISTGARVNTRTAVPLLRAAGVTAGNRAQGSAFAHLIRTGALRVVREGKTSFLILGEGGDGRAAPRAALATPIAPRRDAFPLRADEALIEAIAAKVITYLEQRGFRIA